MQTLELENYGASELSFDEQRGTDGGNPGVLWWAAVTTAIAFHDAVDQILEGWDKDAEAADKRHK